MKPPLEVLQAFLGWSLLVGLCENAHCTDLGQPAHTEVIAHG